MFIDHQRRLIFVHIPKTGGTSITHALESQIEDGFYDLHTQRKHWTAHRILAELETSGYTIAAVVRNPWDRIVSDYQFCLWQTVNLDRYRQRYHLGTWVPKLERLMQNNDFAEFCRREHLAANNYWTMFCTDWQGADLVSDVLRYENLSDDFLDFCRRFGYKHSKLPRRNATPKRQPYREFFDPYKELIEGVADKYAELNRRFGYAY